MTFLQATPLAAAFFNNGALTWGLLACGFAQLSKLFVELVQQRRWRLAVLFETGGMPSSHSAFVTGTAAGIAWENGLDSPLFALAVTVAFVVMYDASGVRMAAGKMAERLNQIGANQGLAVLKTSLGHTKLQVFVGALLGPLVALPGEAWLGSPLMLAQRFGFFQGLVELSYPDGSVLTSQQTIALEAFTAWLNEPAAGQPFVLSGYAGTGKTFLSVRFLALADRAGLCWTVAAPTHKAVGVLRSALENQALRPTWYPSTIHRLLRLKLSRQEERESCEPTEQTATALEQIGLVLLDEASMVDSRLLEITLQCAHPFGTRLVFVGDPAQLPPVGESSSAVFALQRAAQYQLTEVVRHGGPVLRLASGLRTGALPSRQAPLMAAISATEGQVAVVCRDEWIAEAQAALRLSSERLDPDHARLLCFTNRTLERLVPIARRALHGDMADQLSVLPGEVLITRAAVMAPACQEGLANSEQADLVLGSNRELVVRDVAPDRCDLADLGIADAPVIETLRVDVEAGESQLRLRLAPAPGSDGRQRLDLALNDLRSRAKGAVGKQRSLLWRQYFLLRDAFAAVGPAAVLTVHRSQGSSFGDVFVAPDVYWPQEEEVRRQLIYVAVSRARRRVWLVGSSDQPVTEQELWREWLTNDLKLA